MKTLVVDHWKAESEPLCRPKPPLPVWLVIYLQSRWPVNMRTSVEWWFANSITSTGKTYRTAALPANILCREQRAEALVRQSSLLVVPTLLKLNTMWEVQPLVDMAGAWDATRIGGRQVTPQNSVACNQNSHKSSYFNQKTKREKNNSTRRRRRMAV